MYALLRLNRSTINRGLKLTSLPKLSISSQRRDLSTSQPLQNKAPTKADVEKFIKENWQKFRNTPTWFQALTFSLILFNTHPRLIELGFLLGVTYFILKHPPPRQLLDQAYKREGFFGLLRAQFQHQWDTIKRYMKK